MALEIALWLVFVALLVPFAVFFPAWLSEAMSVWVRTETLTMGFILFGSIVLATVVFLGREKAIGDKIATDR